MKLSAVVDMQVDMTVIVYLVDVAGVTTMKKTYPSPSDGCITADAEC